MLSQKQLLMRKIKTLVRISVGGSVAFLGMGVWTGDEKFYQQFLNPILNRIDPEYSHKAAVFVAKHGLMRSAPNETSPELTTSLVKLKLQNPVGIAAGFDKNAECLSGLLKMGFGWVEIGSVTPKPQPGNPKPRVFRLPQDLAVINRYGFNSHGKDVVLERVKVFKEANPTSVVGVNLGANKESQDKVQDYCEGIGTFSDYADYFVINISSPNTPNLRDLQQAENLPVLLQNVAAARNKQRRLVPIFLKVAPDLTDKDVQTICDTLKKPATKVDGLIVSNTTVKRENLKSPASLTGEAGGLSGRPLTEVSTVLISKFYERLQGKIPIIGVGGIFNGLDAYNKIRAGASAVQMYTGLVYQGPMSVSRVKRELSELLKENNFASVEDAVGTASGLPPKS